MAKTPKKSESTPKKDEKSAPAKRAPVNPAKRFPCAPGGSKVKQTDTRKVCFGTKLGGGLAILDVKNPDGSVAYKKGVFDAVADGKTGVEELDVVAIFSLKDGPSPDAAAKIIKLQKGQMEDKAIVIFYQMGDDEDEEIQRKVNAFVPFLEHNTQPYKGSTKKVKIRAAKLDSSEAKTADHHLFAKDIASLLVDMYPDSMTDGTFDDEESTRIFLEQYFSLISVEEAKEIVMQAYEESN